MSTLERRRLHEHWADALPTVLAVLHAMQTTDEEREGVALFAEQAHQWIAVEPEFDRRRGRIDHRTVRLPSWLTVPGLGRFRLCAPLARHLCDAEGRPLDTAQIVRDLRAQTDPTPDHVPADWTGDAR